MLAETGKARAILWQLLLLLIIIGGCYALFSNLQTNLEQRGIASGFGFLQQEAGFNIIQHLIPYSENSSYSRAFVVALLNTLLVSFLGIILATILGFIVGVSRLSSNWLLRQLAAFFVESLRNIPLLLQIFFWYFVVLRSLPSPRQGFEFFNLFFINNRGLFFPSVVIDGNFAWFLFSIALGAILAFYAIVFARKRKGLTKLTEWLSALLIISMALFLTRHLSGITIELIPAQLRGFNFKGGINLIPEFTGLLLALTFYTAAFIAEIVRSGILAVPKGQFEAAASLGFNKRQALRLIVIPQAMRVIIPPLISQYLNLTKNSSLGAAIAYPELVAVFAGTALNQTGQAVEIIAITMAVYLLLSLSISFAINYYNARGKWK